MVIFGYKIERNEKLRTNPMTIWFLGMMVPLLYTAVISSDFFAYYRLGESIIPAETQLMRSGPYSIKRKTTRNDAYILFTSVKTGETYSVSESNFPRDVPITKIAYELEGQPVAYLGLYLENPFQKVWRVRINDAELLTYERALFCYHIEANPSWWIKACILNFLMFLCSLFTTTKVAPPKLSPQPEKAH